MTTNIELNPGRNGDKLAALQNAANEKIEQVAQPQFLSSGNTKTVTSSDASPGSAWTGSWELTRQYGYVRVLTTVASATPTNAGTLTYEFSEGGSTADISEDVAITSLKTDTFVDLLLQRAYYRVKFEPKEALGSTTVIVTTTYRTQYDGPVKENPAQATADGAIITALRQTGVDVSAAAPLFTQDVLDRAMQGRILDALERIQSQLSLITGVSLKRGERIDE